MYDVKFEVFGVVFVCHVAGDDALKQVFVNASGGNVVYDCLHALHETVGVPVVTVMYKKPDADCQCHALVGVLEIMARA